MKLNHLFVVLGLVVFGGSVARADLVTFTLNLDPSSATSNRLSLSFAGGAPVTSDLTGTMSALVDINLTTGAISTWESLFNASAPISATPWSLVAGGAFAGVAVSATTVGASMDTTVAASTVTAGTVPAAEQQIRLISGTVTAPALAFSDTFAPGDSVDIPGTAPVTISSTLNAGFYDIVFTMPINNVQNFGAPGADLLITGTVVARGQIAVPEPSSAIFLLISGSAIAFHRRRWTRV